MARLGACALLLAALGALRLAFVQPGTGALRGSKVQRSAGAKEGVETREETRSEAHAGGAFLSMVTMVAESWNEKPFLLLTWMLLTFRALGLGKFSKAVAIES